MIWRIAGSYEADQELRRDLHQEILLAVWRALPKFRQDAGERTYIARIAHNRAVSHVAREAKRPRVVEIDPAHPSESATPEGEAMERDRTARLQLAIRSLPVALRQPVTLALEGFRPREIADVLGVNANIVSIRLTRAKKALKAALEETS